MYWSLSLLECLNFGIRDELLLYLQAETKMSDIVLLHFTSIDQLGKKRRVETVLFRLHKHEIDIIVTV